MRFPRSVITEKALTRLTCKWGWNSQVRKVLPKYWTTYLPRYLIRSRNTQICANLQEFFLQEVQTFTKLWNLFDHLENSIMETFHTGPLLMLVWVALACPAANTRCNDQCWFLADTRFYFLLTSPLLMRRQCLKKSFSDTIYKKLW